MAPASRHASTCAADAQRAPRQPVEVLALAGSARGEVTECVDEHERGLGRHFSEPVAAGRRRDGTQQPLARPLDAVELTRGAAASGVAVGALDVGRQPPHTDRETRPPSQDAADSSSRCASSKTTASCSGSTLAPEATCAK